MNDANATKLTPLSQAWPPLKAHINSFILLLKPDNTQAQHAND